MRADAAQDPSHFSRLPEESFTRFMSRFMLVPVHNPGLNSTTTAVMTLPGRQCFATVVMGRYAIRPQPDLASPGCLQRRVDSAHRKAESLCNRLGRIPLLDQLPNPLVKFRFFIGRLGFEMGCSCFFRAPRLLFTILLATSFLAPQTIGFLVIRHCWTFFSIKTYLTRQFNDPPLDPGRNTSSCSAS
jgi:hypothetical protein